MTSVVPRTAARAPRLQLLDSFRFLAAIAVVGFHWLYGGIESGKVTSISLSPVADVASYGYLGVELFFMISGFVIASSAHNKTPSQFAVGRAVRLFPAFWVAMLFTVGVILVWGAPMFNVTLVQVLANLPIISGVFDQPYVDGVYWTLFHELVFYATIFLLILARQTSRLDAIFPGWALVMLIIAIALPQYSSIPLLGNVYAFFAGGAIISTIYRCGWNWWRGIGLGVSLYLAISYTVADAVASREGVSSSQTGAITAAIVLFFYVLLLLQIIPAMSSLRIPGSEVLGRLTYPVYLLHATFGYIMLDEFANDNNKWLVYACLFAVVLALSYGINLFVEVRLKQFWYWFFNVCIGTPVSWLERILRVPSRYGARRSPAPSTGSQQKG